MPDLLGPCQGLVSKMQPHCFSLVLAADKIKRHSTLPHASRDEELQQWAPGQSYAFLVGKGTINSTVNWEATCDICAWGTSQAFAADASSIASQPGSLCSAASSTLLAACTCSSSPASIPFSLSLKSIRLSQVPGLVRASVCRSEAGMPRDSSAQIDDKTHLPASARAATPRSSSAAATLNRVCPVVGISRSSSRKPAAISLPGASACLALEIRPAPHRYYHPAFCQSYEPQSRCIRMCLSRLRGSRAAVASIWQLRCTMLTATDRALLREPTGQQ